MDVDASNQVDRVNLIISIEDDFDERILVDSHVCDIPDFNLSDDLQRQIMLYFAPDEELWEDELIIQREWQNDDRIMAMYAARDRRFALGAYLFRLEQHGVNPWDILVDFYSHEQDPIQATAESYTAWLSELSIEERRNLWRRLTGETIRINDGVVDWRNHHWAKIIRIGKFRDSKISKDAAEPVLNAIEEIDHDPRSCYYTTLQVYQSLKDQGYEVDYCEGIVLPELISEPMDHAWIQINDQVAEVTWPYHIPTGGDAVYYGTSIDYGSIQRRLEHRPPATTMILDETEYFQRVQLQSTMSQTRDQNESVPPDYL